MRPRDKRCAQEGCEVRGSLLDKQTQCAFRAPFSSIKIVNGFARGDNCSREATRGACLQYRSVCLPSGTPRLVI